MTLEDILKYEVRFYSPDGKASPVLDYLGELSRTNKVTAIKCLEHIKILPLLVYNNNKAIKSFEHPMHKFYELKIKSINRTEFRFFFLKDNPNLIVIYGFSKNTQKTEKSDINRGVLAIEDYKNNNKSVTLFDSKPQ